MDLLDTDNHNGDGDDDMDILMPTDMDLFDDDVHYSTKFKTLFQRISNVGQWTTSMIKRCVEEEEVYDCALDELESDDSFHDERTTFVSSKMDDIARVFDAWRTIFSQNMESMREIKSYLLDPQEFGYDKDGRRKRIKNTLGSHIFYELTILKGLMSRPKMIDEENTIMSTPVAGEAMNFDTLFSLSMTETQMWVGIAGSFEVTYEEDEQPHEIVEETRARLKHMWTAPLYKFSQSEMVIAILFLTQQLNDVPPSGVGEFERVFNILWIRNAFLFQESHDATVLDDDAMRMELTDVADGAPVLYRVNRNYITFCTFYFGEIMRRLYHIHALRDNEMDIVPIMGAGMSFERIVANTREWVDGFVRKFPDEAFEDLYVQTCKLGYAYVGDDGWFKYKWPNKIRSRGACIAMLRPHLHKKFFSEQNVTPERVLTTVRTNYISRVFVLMAINEQLKVRKHIAWFNGVVVTSDAIEMSSYKLRANKCPIILQVFSNFWTYDKGRVYKCDNDIYKAIAIWFVLLNTRYGNHLHGVDLTEFVRTILRQGDDVQVRGGEIVGEL